MSRSWGWWVVVISIAACSRSAPDSVAVVALDRAEAPKASGSAEMRVAGFAATPAAASQAAQGAAPIPAQERMIVRSAELALQVSDVQKAASQISDLTLKAKGFLGASRLWHEGTSDRATMTVRVPAASLDATIATLRGLAVRVDNESVTGEDVTRQAVDLTAQLTNLRATEAELRALLQTVRLKTQKASDVLEVHQELSRVRGEIDQHEGELQSLTQLAALSTISITLTPDVVAQPIAEDTWQPRGVARDALRALTGTARVAVNGMIWVVVYGAPMLLLGGGLMFMVRRVWRRRAMPQAVV